MLVSAEAVEWRSGVPWYPFFLKRNASVVFLSPHQYAPVAPDCIDIIVGSLKKASVVCPSPNRYSPVAPDCRTVLLNGIDTVGSLKKASVVCPRSPPPTVLTSIDAVRSLNLEESECGVVCPSAPQRYSPVAPDC